MKIEKNTTLASLTSFGIGGKAQYFTTVKDEEELIEAIKWARNKKIPHFILGSGTNVLISDQGIKGLVIKNQVRKIEKKDNKVICSSGVILAQLLDFCLKNQLSGLENLVGVPGTVGAAIKGNAGTKTGSIGQLVEKVTVFGEDGLIYDLRQEECNFDYRQSRFQQTKEIILQAEFLFHKAEQAAIKKKTDKLLETRKDQPQGKSAGSIFKNPSKDKPAGWLIDQCGLKGKKIGQAQISLKHANWIINLGGAKAKDVVQLIRLCQREVKKKFKIDLDLEIKLIGEFNG